jgi:hypothetical protein
MLTIEQSDDRVVRTEDVQSLIAATEVIEVRLDEVHAGPLGKLTDPLVVDVKVEEPQIGRTDFEDRLLVRFTHQVSCFGESTPDQVTDIRLSHVVALQMKESITVRSAVVAAWVETNIYFIAYPYVRQSVTALTASLGMPAVVLGYLSRDQRPITGGSASSD